MNKTHDMDVVIIGAGIVGLGIGVGLLRLQPKTRVLILESETELALHGSGRNSGVIHAGFYYPPGSLKASLTSTGNELLRQMCRDENVLVRDVGKVVVVRGQEEIPRLMDLATRAEANGVNVELIDEKRLYKIEPLARTHLAAIWSPSTAVADPIEVTKAMALVFQRLGGEVRLSAPVKQIIDSGVVLKAHGERIRARHVVNAAGLYADKLAHSSGAGNNYVVLPFKGLYLYGSGASPPLQRHVYPVPDPRNPFLGVHLTVTVAGQSKIGPTAIPALSRLNYTKLGGIRPDELLGIVTNLPKFLFSPHHDGFGLIRSELPKYLRRVLVKQAQVLVPSITTTQFTNWGKSGIRAQLFNVREKRLEMDFVVERNGSHTHVLNAVSPAWTGSLSFGRHIAAGIIDSLDG